MKQKEPIKKIKTPRFNLFQLLSPFYGLFFQHQQRLFRQEWAEIARRAGLPAQGEGRTILDIGCGTGALASVLAENGWLVTGADPASGMLRVARRKTKGLGIHFLQADVLDGLPFADGSFYAVISSYVAHGLPPKGRRKLYAEMRRLAAKTIVLYDWNRERRLVSDVAETLEGGDYFHFIQTAPEEMRAAFGNLGVVRLKRQTALYIAHKPASKNKDDL